MTFDLQVAFNIAVGLVSAFGGWILKSVTDRLDNLQQADSHLTDKVQAIEVLVAGQYVKRDDLDRMAGAIFTKLDRIEAKIDSKVDKP